MFYSKLSDIDVSIILFTLSAVPALWVGYDWHLGIPTLITLFCGCLLYFLVSRFAVNDHGWRLIAGGLVILGSLVAVYFITQAGRLEYDEKVKSIYSFSSWFSTLFPALTFWKPQTNSISTFLEGPLFLCVPLSIGWISRREKWFWRSLAFVIFMALLLSSSRGAWLAVLVAGSIWIAIHWRPMRLLLFMSGVTVLCLGILVMARGSLRVFNEVPLINGFLNAYFNRPDRFEVIWNSLLLATDYTFSGIGLGKQFGLVYSRYQLFLPNVFLTYSHNLMLQVWLEQGLIGLLAWLGLITAALTKIFIPVSSPRRLEQEAAWVGMIAILVHGAVDARMYEDLWCWLPFFVLIGLLLAVITTEERMLPIQKYVKWLPLGVPIIFSLAILTNHPCAALTTNIGAYNQLHADLSPGLSAEEKTQYLDRANNFYQQSVNLVPYQRGANYRLGLIAFEKLDFENAILHFERARNLRIAHKGLNKALGLTYTFTGRLEEGKPLLKDQINIVNELNSWGWYFSTLKQIDVSKNAYEQAQQIQP